jgi:hypothetical protein
MKKDIRHRPPRFYLFPPWPPSRHQRLIPESLLPSPQRGVAPAKRGASPLSKLSPPSNQIVFQSNPLLLIGDGDKEGKYIKTYQKRSPLPFWQERGYFFYLTCNFTCIRRVLPVTLSALPSPCPRGKRSPGACPRDMPRRQPYRSVRGRCAPAG